VWAPLGREEQGRVALNTTIAALEFFETYYDQPFTLPKLDLVAVPAFEDGKLSVKSIRVTTDIDGG
jgi:aminopeptidase N